MLKGIIKAALVFFVLVFIAGGMQTAFAEGYDKYGLLIDDGVSPKNAFINVENEISYLPLSQIQKDLGISSITYNTDGTVSIIKAASIINVGADGSIIVDGQPNRLIPAVRVKDKEVYVPVLFITDILKYKVELLDEITCLRIITKENVLPASRIIDRYKLLFGRLDQKNAKIAYLTFDDGIDRKITVQVLDTLKEYNVRASFFIIGNTIDKNKDILRRMVSEGHTIGNHSYTHNKKIIYKGIAGFVNELHKTDDTLFQVTGRTNNLFRPPYGMPYIKGQEYRDALSGYRIINWNVDSMDSRKKGIKSDEIAANVINQVKNKQCAVILFHCNAAHSETVKALPKVIEYLLDNGFVISNIKEDSILTYKY